MFLGVRRCPGWGQAASRTARPGPAAGAGTGPDPPSGGSPAVHCPQTSHQEPEVEIYKRKQASEKKDENTLSTKKTVKKKTKLLD